MGFMDFLGVSSFLIAGHWLMESLDWKWCRFLTFPHKDSTSAKEKGKKRQWAPISKKKKKRGHTAKLVANISKKWAPKFSKERKERQGPSTHVSYMMCYWPSCLLLCRSGCSNLSGFSLAKLELETKPAVLRKLEPSCWFPIDSGIHAVSRCSALNIAIIKSIVPCKNSNFAASQGQLSSSVARNQVSEWHATVGKGLQLGKRRHTLNKCSPYT
uniref:Uncharacterized protein n=1 Tax=Arundo donax TaxID=35708 RepID=A0A0A9A0L1_ARUDO